jgi:UDP-N-acetylmuramate dehydrogenase
VTTFAELTTMRVGGPIRTLWVAETADDVIDLIRKADAEADPVLVVGGGSNLVVGDEGWDGPVVKVATTRFDIDGESVTAQAGVDWDTLVRASIAAGLSGLESLSGVPGSVGATPVQNVGAYGGQISDMLTALTVFDRHTGATESWGPDRCGFGRHRDSVFKHTDRWVILDVTLGLVHSGQSRPIRYDGLAAALQVPLGATAPTVDVRQAVLDLRRSKGMVLDPDDHDTWSVGSFFLNPVLTDVPSSAQDCPQWPDIDGTKLSAAWLIEHSGFVRGYGEDWGSGTVTLSRRHTLAVTNRGGATTSDIMKFAGHIRDGVEACFDVRLLPECHLVNCVLG